MNVNNLCRRRHDLSNILKLQAAFLYSIYHQGAGKTSLFHMQTHTETPTTTHVHRHNNYTCVTDVYLQTQPPTLGGCSADNHSDVLRLSCMSHVTLCIMPGILLRDKPQQWADNHDQTQHTLTTLTHCKLSEINISLQTFKASSKCPLIECSHLPYPIYRWTTVRGDYLTGVPSRPNVAMFNIDLPVACR